jgi:hypothetical protein
MNIDMIKEYIQENELDVPNRNTAITYQRYYLYALLRTRGMPYQNIALMFNKKHPSVIHGIDCHNYWMNQHDELYLYCTLKLREQFSFEKYYKPLQKQVIDCQNMKELNKLKSLINKNIY